MFILVSLLMDACISSSVCFLIELFAYLGTTFHCMCSILFRMSF